MILLDKTISIEIISTIIFFDKMIAFIINICSVFNYKYDSTIANIFNYELIKYSIDDESIKVDFYDKLILDISDIDEIFDIDMISDKVKVDIIMTTTSIAIVAIVAKVESIFLN